MTIASYPTPILFAASQLLILNVCALHMIALFSE